MLLSDVLVRKNYFDIIWYFAKLMRYWNWPTLELANVFFAQAELDRQSEA